VLPLLPAGLLATSAYFVVDRARSHMADGRVVVQGDGVGDISPLEPLLQKLAETTQSSASPVPR
jgi:hypothetical protein